MKALVILLVLAAVAGVPIWMAMQPPDFGVNASNPLGTLDKMEQWLVEKGYQKQEMELDASLFEGVRHGQGSRMFRFSAPNESRNGYLYHVTVIHDGLGVVRGVSAGFYTGSKEVDSPSSTAERFALHVWTELSGSPPAFIETAEGRGIFARAIRVCYLQSGTVLGSWKKNYRSNLDVRTLYDTVLIFTEE